MPKRIAVIDADTIRNESTMATKEYRETMKRLNYSIDEAAKQLAISRRIMADFHSGAKPVPPVVALALRRLTDIAPYLVKANRYRFRASAPRLLDQQFDEQ
jgi:hypothetical protein